MAVQNFTESMSDLGKPTVDRESGVIRGVRILGKVSKNGREYSEQALSEAATAYQGLAVNTNHPSRDKATSERSVEDGFGWLESVAVRDGGVYGDLHVLKSHPMADRLFEAAERKPDRFGLSHNAQGELSTRGGKRIVESIKSVRSVDLVQNPATNRSLFESLDEEPMTTKTLKQLIESLPKGHKGRKGLTALIEMDDMPMIAADMPVEMPAAEAGVEPAAVTPEAAIKSAFKAAMAAILDDDTLDLEATIEKIRAMLEAQANALGVAPASGDGEETPAADAADAAVTESLQEQISQLTKQLKDRDTEAANRTLLESHKIVITPQRLAVLKSVTGKTERTALLEDWQKAAPIQKPRPGSSPPAHLLESGSVPKTAKEMAKRYA